MFGALRMAIDSLNIPVDNDALVELFVLRDRLEAKIANAVAANDTVQLWEADGATSMTSWLRDRASMSASSAVRTVGTAKRLTTMPDTAEAWRTGKLTGGQVEAVIKNVGPKLAGLFSEHESEIVPSLRGLSVSATAVAMQEWRNKALAVFDPAPDDEDDSRSSLHLSTILDGSSVLNGTFDTEAAATVRTALRLAVTADDEDTKRTPAQRRADALVDICGFFLTHRTDPPKGRNRPHVSVIVDLDRYEQGLAGATVIDGGLLSMDSTERMLCDSVLHRVVMAGKSLILDYGTSTQTISPALWESIVARDHHCRFPGCDRPPWWCDGHHLDHYADGGTTDPDNLVAMCRRHHTLLHERGWHAKLRPDGILEITDPQGRLRTTAPAGTLYN